MKIEYGEITTEKVGKFWRATTNTTSPLKATANMMGITEEIAKEKLRLFLNNEPYKHLDNL